MARIEKTVFISYRRTNLPWALLIYQNLTAKGYDVFFDYESIASGSFEKIIQGNIRARAHFLVVLTPAALERCNNPDDWLRREIETALDDKRNIVPLFLDGFDYDSPSAAPYLTGKLALLRNYNGLNIPAGYFDEGMERLHERFLNVSLDAVLHPVSNTVQKVVQEQQVAASKAKLTTQEWLAQGDKHFEAKEYDEAIHCFTEAINLKPDYAEAYNNRGNAHKAKGNLDEAIQDYTETIRLKPNYKIQLAASYNRGFVSEKKAESLLKKWWSPKKSKT